MHHPQVNYPEKGERKKTGLNKGNALKLGGQATSQKQSLHVGCISSLSVFSCSVWERDYKKTSPW
jgi:hypothetical protein